MKKLQYTCVEILALGPGTAILISPTGEQKILESFPKQDIFFSYEGKGLEIVSKQGEAYYVFRFYPEQVGTWKIGSFRFEGKEILEEQAIEIEANPNAHGFVEVSKKDPRYLAYSDGMSYMPIGINLVYPDSIFVSDSTEFGLSNQIQYLGLKQYERWFKVCKDNGVNLVRIWLGHEYFSPDTENAGELNLIQLAKIDALIALAEDYNMKLKITIETFRYFTYDNVSNSDSFSDKINRLFGKRLYYEGKRCESMTEWLVDKKWQDLWLKKMKELAKRYAGNPTVMAVELWNEMNACSESFDTILTWNKKMLPEVKRLFPKQLVTNSLGSFDSDESLQNYTDFCWDLSEIKQMHRYLDRGAKYEICHDIPLKLIRDGMSILHDEKKPFFVAETGAVNDCHSGAFVLYSADHRGILFCDLVYSPLFLGAAGCGHIWHWDHRYVEAKNLYCYFKPLKELCRDVSFDDEEFQCQVYEDAELILLLLKGKTTSLGYLRNKADTWQRVVRDMESDCPITEKEIRLKFSVTYCEVVRIWQDEVGSVSVEGDRLYLKDVKYGMLLKLH